MSQEVNEQVETGFEDLIPATAEPSTPQPAERGPAPLTAEVLNQTQGPPVAESDNPVNFVMPSPPAMSETARKNQEIFQKILEARNQPPAVIPVQPSIPRVLEQTRLEMEEGRRQNERHNEHFKAHPRRVEDINRNAIVLPVSRPADWSPTKDPNPPVNAAAQGFRQMRG